MSVAKVPLFGKRGGSWDEACFPSIYRGKDIVLGGQSYRNY